MSRLLLDTNVLIWLLTRQHDQVPDQVVDALQDVGNDVLISAATVWEIAIKRSVGKLEIEDRWPSAIRMLGFEHCPITAEHASAVESLAWHHRDPFDRLLIAQAGVEDAVLVSADKRIRKYEIHTLWL